MNKILKEILTVRWNPTKDLAAVALTWFLVVGALYTATNILGTNVWGGMAYFLVYAVLGALIFGVGFPVYWMVVVRKRTLADLGIRKENFGISLVLQLVFSATMYLPPMLTMSFPSFDKLFPLISLALCIGLFEAIFWRGWVQNRFEEAFGTIPGIILASAVYAAYHIGYGMPLSEMAFLFFIGLMFAAAFRLTRNILILYPIFQPAGQLMTLLKDGLDLPLAASIGFFEALALMIVVIVLAARYQKKTAAKLAGTPANL